MEPAAQINNQQRISNLDSDPSEEVKSWKGRTIKCILYTTSGLSIGISIYEVIAGGLLSANILQGFSKGGDYLAIAGITAGIGISSLILGCCSKKWIAEKKLESNIQELEDLSKIDEIKELKDKVEELNQIIRDFESQIGELKQINLNLEGHLSEKIKELNGIKTDFNKTFDEKDGVIKKLNATIHSTGRENEELKNNIKTIKKENRKLSAEVSSLEREEGDVVIQIRNYRNENEKLKSEKELLAKEIIDFRAACSQLKGELDNLKQNYEEEKKGKLELSRKLQEIKEDKDSLSEASIKLEQAQVREKELITAINLLLKQMEGLTEMQEELQPLIQALRDFNSAV